jgi:hypothetical protein
MNVRRAPVDRLALPAEEEGHDELKGTVTPLFETVLAPVMPPKAPLALSGRDEVARGWPVVRLGRNAG